MRLSQRFVNLTAALEDLLFPPQCALCDADVPHGMEPMFCQRCGASLRRIPAQFCRKCGHFLPDDAQTTENCVRCRRRRLHYHRVVPLGPYEGRLREAILRLKRDRSGALAAQLAHLLWSRRGDDLRALDIDAVVPVPMHWRRRLERGTNGPDVVAHVVANLRGVPVATSVAKRRHATKLQTRLDPAARFRNVRGAFGVTIGYDIRGCRLLVVDDVLTTGATCNELAKTLRSLGAASVAVAVLARAVHDAR